MALLSGCESRQLDLPAGFRIHPDFHMQLVASEPLLFDPVDLQFDEQGRTYVLEMPGYPNRDAESRLVELIDSDKDGIYDRRQLMDDSLGIASSFMPYKKGFLVASPPYLLWIADTDGDGTIDSRQKLMDGFSTGNLQHNFNGLNYGLDNWIYAANGGNSGEPFFEAHPEEAIDLRGGDVKFDLEAEQLVRIGESSGGFKLTFDDWGRLYETHNLEHVSQLLFEDRYLEGLPLATAHAMTNISDHEDNGLARIYPVGEQETRVNHPEQAGYFSGACGITHYGGGAFPSAFNNSLLVADCVLNLVHIDALSNDGSAMKASRIIDKAEFLASKDRSFRPVNMSVGPDGALYVIDMHREVIEHPEWIPDQLEETMDLEAGKDKGRIYRITPKDNWSPIPLDFDPSDTPSLVKALGNANQWTRLTAQRVLVSNKTTSAIPLLKEALNNSKNPLGRLHCYWTLEGLQAFEAPQLKIALRDPVPEIRENAVKIAERHLNDESGLVEDVIALTKDPDAKVRLRSVLALGTLSDRAYNENQNAILTALSDLVSEMPIDGWASKALAASVQRQALPFSLSILARNEGQLPPAKLDIISMLTEKMAKDGDLEALTTLISTCHGQKMEVAPQTALIEAMARGWGKRSEAQRSPPDPMKFLRTLGLLESQNEIALLRASGQLRQNMGLPASNGLKVLMHATKVSVFDSALPAEQRLEQLKLLALEDFEERRTVLFQLLDSKQPLVLQEEALSQLGQRNDPTVGEKILELWPILGPNSRKTATDILLYKSFNHGLLLTAMETGKVNLGEFNLDLERRRVLLFSDDQSVRNRAKLLFNDAGVVTRKAAIEKMRPALTLKGSADAGAQIFNVQCAQCHRYGNMGKEVGPVLTEVSRKSKEALLYDILDPNAAVDTQYLNHQVKTKEGNIFSGLVSHESDLEISLKMIGGSEKTIPKSNIEQFTSLGMSLMLEGLEANINPQEMANLLAFLQQTPSKF
ncbi:MAG: PVC-type heme-binding CxxCH protein [Flavobacteriaceae bacterium]